MRLPVEIQVLILREALEAIPLDDVWRARAVNTVFQREIDSPIMKCIQLETFNSKPLSNPSPKLPREKISWTELPYQTKRIFLKRKVQNHHQDPSVWSSLVHNMLDLEKRTTEETDILINKIIDAWLCSNDDRNGCYELLEQHPHQFNEQFHRKRTFHVYSPFTEYAPADREADLEPLQTTLAFALVLSAIIRGDTTQLRTFLNQGFKITDHSPRIGTIPLHIAAKKGGKEIIELLIANKCPLSYWHDRREYWHQKWHVLGVMATNGNSAGFSVWAGYLRRSGNLQAWDLRKALTGAARSGSVEILDFIRDGCGAERDQTGHVLREAVDFGRLDLIRHVLCRDGVDVNARMSHFEKGLLLRVMYQTPDSRRADIVEFLLGKGADPDGGNAAKNKTPLEVAIWRGDYASAKVLLRYGATVNFDQIMRCLLPGIPLWTSRFQFVYPCCRKTATSLVRLLWEERDVYQWRGKSYAICRDEKVIANVESVFLDLEWSEQDVEDAEIDFVIDVYRSSR